MHTGVFKVINWFHLKKVFMLVRLQRMRLSLVYLTFFNLLLILSDLLLRKLFVLSVTKNLQRLERITLRTGHF